MDKVKVFLAVLKKYHFWVLCGVIFLTLTVVWSMAASSVQEEAELNKRQIEGALNDAKAVQQVNQHPNQGITEAYHKQTEILKQQVFQVWNALYTKQRENVLRWPPVLGEKFVAYVENLPFGSKFNDPTLPEDYQFYVKKRWEDLPKIIKAKAVESEKADPSKRAPTATRAPIPDYIVIWKDQEEIRKQLFRENVKPTYDWVWVTQEDLWIYETLLKIVSNTNAGSLGPHNAVISTILDLAVGKSAASEAGGTGHRITTADSAAAAEEEPSNTAGPVAGAGGESLMDGRYVNQAGVPYTTGTEALNDEFKRIPIRLVLRMDPREIPNLLVHCANAILPVEVQQIRVNVKDSSGPGKAGVVSPDLNSEDIAAGRKVAHVEVAMQGVIYIFNPPDPKKLKIEVQQNPAATGPVTANEAFGGTPPGTTPGTAAEAFGDGPATTPATPTDPAATPGPITATPGVPTATAEVPTGEPPAAGPPTGEPAAVDPAKPATPAPPAEGGATEKKPSLESLFEEDPAGAPATEAAPATDPAAPAAAPGGGE